MPVPSLAELRLAIGRKGSPLKQKDLADLANIDPGYLSAIEAGKYVPSPFTQIKLATALAVDFERLGQALSETLRRKRDGEPQIILRNDPGPP